MADDKAEVGVRISWERRGDGLLHGKRSHAFVSVAEAWFAAAQIARDPLNVNVYLVEVGTYVPLADWPVLNKYPEAATAPDPPRPLDGTERWVTKSIVMIRGLKCGWCDRPWREHSGDGITVTCPPHMERWGPGGWSPVPEKKEEETGAVVLAAERGDVLNIRVYPYRRVYAWWGDDEDEAAEGNGDRALRDALRGVASHE